MSNFLKVKIFMKKFKQEVKSTPCFHDNKTIRLRIDLIKEELLELENALIDKNIEETADALTDILYVTYGAGHSFGIDLDKCFDEVQKSNMSKLDKSGNPIYDNKGKVMKGPSFFKPNFKKILNIKN